jgi:hypothetical protein
MKEKSRVRCVYLKFWKGKPYRYMAKVVYMREPHYLGCFETEAQAIKALNAFYMKKGLYSRLIKEG